MASHGEILHEKFAPYMLSWLPSLLPLGGCAWHSAANFLSLSRASASPPTMEALAAGFPSYITVDDNIVNFLEVTKFESNKSMCQTPIAMAIQNDMIILQIHFNLARNESRSNC